jgi:hypothetical protein
MSPVGPGQPSWLPVWQLVRRLPGPRSAAGGASAVPWSCPGPRARLHDSRRLVAAVRTRLASECRRAERPRSRWAGCGPDLPSRGPAAGRSSAGRPSDGVTQLRSRCQIRFSTRSSVSRSPHSLLSTARLANRPGRARCSSRRLHCEAPRGCGSGSCRAGS